MERPLGQYVDRPDAYMPCCPSCGSARVTSKDEEGLQDCLACGIWFDPCLREELDAYLEAQEAQGQAHVIHVRDLGKAMEAREAGLRALKELRLMSPGEGRADCDVESDALTFYVRGAAHLARQALGEGAPTEDDLCQECGADIRTGYSWEGLCVVCAERYHNPEHPDFAMGEATS